MTTGTHSGDLLEAECTITQDSTVSWCHQQFWFAIDIYRIAPSDLNLNVCPSSCTECRSVRGIFRFFFSLCLRRGTLGCFACGAGYSQECFSALKCS